LEDWLRMRAWRKRTGEIIELQAPRVLQLGQKIPAKRLDLVERGFSPISRLRWFKRLEADWQGGGFGRHGACYLMLLLILGLLGWFAGCRIGGLILGAATAYLFPFLLTIGVQARAERQRQRFPEQLPLALDGLASGLSAGLSFHQAIAYTVERVPNPAARTFRWIEVQLDLGHSLEETLSAIRVIQQDKAFGLLIEGILLQRQFGGDLIAMLEETANLVRERNELEREAKSVTAQGRLSGIVIAALVPISAGFLLLFNPQYINVLFSSTIGQVFIVVALGLLLVGWGVISKLIRIRY
jgi:tight adherence protein B